MTNSSTMPLSVRQDLTQSLLKVLEFNPADAIGTLESILLQNITPSVPAQRCAKPCARDIATAVARTQLFGTPSPAVNADGEEEAVEPDEYGFLEPTTPELCVSTLPWCGVSMPKTELLEVLLAMKRLGGDANKQIKELRLFGKFYTLSGQYYIFECSMNERPSKPSQLAPCEMGRSQQHSYAQEEEEEDATVKPGDAPAENEMGCNLYMYFACTSLQGPYTLLEDVMPAHIRAARSCGKFLTGNLDSSVQSFPPFPGQERHFLRAQIARIRHATCLCPKGLFTLPEEAEEPELNEEYSSLAVNEMSDPANWVHWSPHVKQMGVTVLPEIPEVEEGEPEPVLLPEQTEADPGKLVNASKDGPVDGMRAWRPAMSTKSRNLRNKTAGVQSVRWPGAVAVTDGTSWMNVYVGWGLKRSESSAKSRTQACAVMQLEQEPPKENSQLPPAPVKEEEGEEDE